MNGWTMSSSIIIYQHHQQNLKVYLSIHLSQNGFHFATIMEHSQPLLFVASNRYCAICCTVVWPAGEYITSTSLFVLGVWVHVVVTVTGSAFIMYGNGAQIAYGYTTHTPMITTRKKQYIGRSNWPTDAFFSGSLAYLRIWNGYALSADEATALYQLTSYCAVGSYGSSNTCSYCPSGHVLVHICRNANLSI